MTRAKPIAPNATTGSAAVDTKAIYHPRAYPTANPPRVIKIVIKNVGTFSPIAP
jgi:hypothetical protein